MKNLINVFSYLSLQNAIVADKGGDPDANVVKDAKKGASGLKKKIIEKNSPQISKAEENPKLNFSGLEKTSPKIGNNDQVFRQNSKDSAGQSPKITNNDLPKDNSHIIKILSNHKAMSKFSDKTQRMQPKNPLKR